MGRRCGAVRFSMVGDAAVERLPGLVCAAQLQLCADTAGRRNVVAMVKQRWRVPCSWGRHVSYPCMLQQTRVLHDCGGASKVPGREERA